MSMLLSQFVPAYSSPAVSTSPFFTSESLWRQPQGQRDCSFEKSHQGQCSKFPPSGPHSIGISSHFCAVCQCSHHWLFPISIYKFLAFSSFQSQQDSPPDCTLLSICFLHAPSLFCLKRVIYTHRLYFFTSLLLRKWS